MKMKQNRLWLSAAALMALPLAPHPGSAQDAFLLDEITVTANRAPTAAARTGTSVTVVTEDDLADTGAVQLSDYLNRLPGVSVTQAGPIGNAANLRIRGADWRYISVYVDGVRVSDPSLTETVFNFGHLRTADVGRVELLRGSQSALYGGSAVGGVIAITSRTPAEDGLSQSAEAEGGSFGTLSGRYTLGWRGDGHEAAFTFSHLRSDGFSAADEAAGNTEPDGYEGTRLSFSGRYRVTDSLTLGASAFAQLDRQEYDGFDPVTWAPADADNVQHRREAGGRVFAEFAMGTTDHMLEVTGYRVQRAFREAGGNRDYTGRRLGFAWQGTTEMNPALTLVYGADTTLESASYTALPSGTERTRISGGFAQALWAPGDALDIAATARVDRTSNFGTFPTGRLALAWRPDNALIVRAALATGFRAPSIDERFGNYGSFVGNPALRPEKSRSFELGVERTLAGGGSVSATVFRLDVSDLITFMGASTPATLDNLPGRSRRQGVELAASFPLGERFDLDAAYTYTDARRAGGARLGLVPRHDLSLALGARLGERLKGTVSVQHAGDRLNTFASARMPDYTVVNAAFRYALTDRADLTFRVDNVFNRQYQQVDGYGTSNRAAYLGVAARF